MTLSDFSIPSYKKLVSKHPKTADINAPNPENVASFFVTDRGVLSNYGVY